jgi:hypothetical protein
VSALPRWLGRTVCCISCAILFHGKLERSGIQGWYGMEGIIQFKGKGDWLDGAFDASYSQRLPVPQLLLQAPSPALITTTRSILSSNCPSPFTSDLMFSNTSSYQHTRPIIHQSPKEHFLYPSNHNNMAPTFRAAAHHTEDSVGNSQRQWDPIVILLKHDLVSACDP